MVCVDEAGEGLATTEYGMGDHSVEKREITDEIADFGCLDGLFIWDLIFIFLF